MNNLKFSRGNTLREVILKSGYNIRQFCKEVGISEPLLYKAMAGQTDLTFSKVLKISKSLKVSLRDVAFLLGKDVTGIPDDN